METNEAAVMFHDMLTDAVGHQRVKIETETEVYLTHLLVDFLRSERLYSRDQDGWLGQEPLAFMLKQALELPRAQQAWQLKRLGDTALYVSGFFPDSLNGRMVDIDYYAAMGERAYDSAGELSRGKMAAVYQELAAKFLCIMDILNEISERTMITSNQGIIRLYERYQKTGSNRIRELLMRQGVSDFPAHTWSS